MIRSILRLKGLRCSRTARIAVLFAVLGPLAGIAVRAEPQTVRPLQGTLVVKIPRGLLPSQDYWVYVNAQIVSAPPYGSFTKMDREFMRVDEEYWDSTGQAAASVRGRFTYLRPGLRERIFESQSIQLAPGKYVVELVTRAVNVKGFPFGVARLETQVAAGRIEEMEFGIPVGTDETRIVPAIGRPYGLTPDKQLEYLQNDFNRTVLEYEKLPIVAVLNQIQLNLSLTPPIRAKVFANLPDSMGGGRELDVRQLSVIIGDLESDYKFRSIDDARLLSAPAPIPQLQAYLATKIGEYNTRISSFRQIIKALEQVK